ncbi:hypothetical protein BDB01DRAFT_109099 [Pilobolus umbonatus]|nr:hypothetical protein BDB01DRAFT_109099 [Pilobolus umbonatus]
MNSSTYITNMERMMVDLVGEIQSLTKEVHDMKNTVQSDVLALKEEVQDLKSTIQERFPSVPTPSSALSFGNWHSYIS